MKIKVEFKNIAKIFMQMCIIILVFSYFLDTLNNLIFYKIIISIPLAILLSNTKCIHPANPKENFLPWIRKNIKRISIISLFGGVISYGNEDTMYEIIITVILCMIIFTLFKWISPRFIKT